MIDEAADLEQQKLSMREKLRFRRKHFVANLDEMARLAAFRSIPAPLGKFLENIPVIGAYAARGDEPDILPLVASNARQIALPHHEGRTDSMAFKRWQPGDALEQGPWRTPQPRGDGMTAEPSLLFCPLLAFDRRGGRLGQGGGHYDRYFAAHPNALRIGVAWSVQEVDAVPLGAHDVMLDAILTEQEFITMGDRA